MYCIPSEGECSHDDDCNTGGDDEEVDDCSCDDETVCELIAEYKDIGVDWIPGCHDFSTGGSTANFSWDEFMGWWSDGNENGKHRPYGIMSIMADVQELRDLYGGPISLSSGYRCPQGNTDVRSEAPKTSRHMHGDAVDISTGCNQPYFTKLAELAKAELNFDALPWGKYEDCLLNLDK